MTADAQLPDFGQASVIVNFFFLGAVVGGGYAVTRGWTMEVIERYAWSGAIVGGGAAMLVYLTLLLETLV